MNNRSTERLTVTANAQKNLTTFPGGKCPPPCPCLRAPMVFSVVCKVFSDW